MGLRECGREGGGEVVAGWRWVGMGKTTILTDA